MERELQAEIGEVVLKTTLRLAGEHAAMLMNLTSTQARCTELLEEVRQLRAELRKVREGGEGSG